MSKISNEGRISLTPKCNYKCFFCHNDGLDKESKNNVFDINENIKLIEDLVDNGITDITFTGGEPLIHKKEIIAILNGINKEKYDKISGITIVTNSALLDIAFIDSIKKFRTKIKFNISLHSADEEKYKKITGQKKVLLKQLIEKTQILKLRGIKYKFNCVMLKNINTSTKDIKELIEFSEKHGATHLKLIELLIKNSNEFLYPKFYSIESIEDIIKNNKFATLEKIENRKVIYLKKVSGLKIELQKCICKYGCKKCSNYRSHTFSSNLIYYPCFEYSSINYNYKKNSINEIIKKGNNKIALLSKEYGAGSPSLVQDRIYKKAKKEVFFRISKDQIEIIKNIAKKIEMFDFTEIYYNSKLNPEKRIERGKIIKIRQNHDNEKIIKIVSLVNVFEVINELYINKIVFMDENEDFFKGSMDMAKKILNSVDYYPEFQLDFKGNLYKLNNSDVKISISELNKDINICMIEIDDNSKIEIIKNIIKDFELKIIKENFYKFLLNSFK